MIRLIQLDKRRKTLLVGTTAAGAIATRYGTVNYRKLSTADCSGSSSPSTTGSAATILPPRSEQVDRLSSQEFDVLIVGGGATGCGAALDAATRGLSTALIERGDFGNETRLVYYYIKKKTTFWNF